LRNVRVAPNTTGKVLLPEVKTRWNSTILMLQRAGQLHAPITLFQATNQDVERISAEEGDI